MMTGVAGWRGRPSGLVRQAEPRGGAQPSLPPAPPMGAAPQAGRRGAGLAAGWAAWVTASGGGELAWSGGRGLAPGWAGAGCGGCRRGRAHAAVRSPASIARPQLALLPLPLPACELPSLLACMLRQCVAACAVALQGQDYKATATACRGRPLGGAGRCLALA